MPSSSIGALHQLLGWDSFAESRLSPREKHKQVFSVAQISLMMTRFTTVSQSGTPQEHLASDYKKIWRINEAKFFSHGILLESIVFAFVLPEVFWMQQTHSNSQITFYRFAAGLDNKADSGSDYRVEREGFGFCLQFDMSGAGDSSVAVLPSSNLFLATTKPLAEIA